MCYGSPKGEQTTYRHPSCRCCSFLFVLKKIYFIKAFEVIKALVIGTQTFLCKKHKIIQGNMFTFMYQIHEIFEAEYFL